MALRVEVRSDKDWCRCRRLPMCREFREPANVGAELDDQTMAEIPVIVLLDDRDDLQKVKANCEMRGRREVRALPRLGILKGLVDEGRVADLAKVPSVRSVEQEREIKLPPPGSPVQ